MNNEDLNYYNRMIANFHEYIQDREHEGAKSIMSFIVSTHVDNIVAFEATKTDSSESLYQQDKLNEITSLLQSVQQSYPYYFPALDLQDLDAIKVYHQKYMDELLEDEDFARDMGVEPRKTASIYDDDDDVYEMAEYDEEAELDMMFPNREDDDNWDDF